LTAEKKAKSAAPREPRFRSILFICAANTARSVMAEHILRRELDALGFEHNITITSAGIAPYARDGALVSLDTRLALRDVGIDIGDEATSTDLKRHPEMLEQADLIIAMTEQQARELIDRFPAAGARPVFTLRSFAGEAGDIEDPYEKGDIVFAECRQQIHRLVPTIIERLFH
jgi:protein-tyrosine-phosphatase